MASAARTIPRSKSVQTSDMPFSSSPTTPYLNRQNSLSTSPTFTFPSSHHSMSSMKMDRQPKVLHSLDSGDLRVLLVENISQNAVNGFKAAGFQVDFFTKAWSEEELLEKIGTYHAIGIRSKTKITSKVLKAATKVRVFEILSEFVNA